jgi:predicted transposase YdaD
MSKPFDATLKELVTGHPVDWLTQLGVPVTAPPEVLNVDLSTVSAAADALIRVGETVVHIDVESGPDDFRPRRMLLYNVLAHHHTGLPVHSVVVLLRPNAGNVHEDGLDYAPLPGGSVSFRYRVVRAWELDAEEVLNAGVGFLPIAVLARPPAGQTRRQALPQLAERIAARASQEARPEAAKILTAAYLLSAMHVDATVAHTIFSKVKAMEDSPGYLYIQELGAIKHNRQLLLEMGKDKFGDPTEKQANKVAAINDIDRLDRLMRKLVTAKSWNGLLRTQ